MNKLNSIQPIHSEETNIINKINRYMELKELVSEYESIKRSLKKHFEGKYESQLGGYLITGKEVIRKSYVVDECIYWDMRIKKV